MKPIDVSFSIVLFNNHPTEVECILNCIKKVSLKNETYIIDNSKSNELKLIVEKFKNTRYSHSGMNLGYGRAHNIAINEYVSKSKYHIILNPDISFAEGTIEVIYNFMEKNPDVGQVMPKILYKDGSIQPLCKLLPKPSDLIIRRFLKPLGFQIHLNYDLENFNYNSIIEVPSLSGCFMFVRSEILEKVGGFDSRFFLYLEDFDLTRRIHRISKTIFFPDAIARHRFDKASYNNPKMLKHHIISAIKYFNKWGWFLDNERNKYNKRALKALDKLIYNFSSPKLI